jgi:hypothetical protein
VAEFGKILVFFGLLIAFFGVILIFAGRMHMPVGRLPGDIVYRGKNTTFYFPLATCIVLSIVLSLVLYLVGRAGHR